MHTRGACAPPDTAALTAQIADLEAKLAPYDAICDRLKAARKHLRDLEEALLERLDSARAGLTPVQARDLALDLAREALVRVLTAGVAAHRQQIVTAVENVWDKYRVSLAARESARAEVAGKLNGMLEELGYA